MKLNFINSKKVKKKNVIYICGFDVIQQISFENHIFINYYYVSIPIRILYLPGRTH